MRAMERTTYRPIPLFLSDLQDQPDPRASEPFAVIQRTSMNEGAEPSKTLDAETLAALITRAKSLLALGDIAVARLLLERAANAQDGTAAFLLAQTYDPAVLGVRDTRSITPDPRGTRLVPQGRQLWLDGCATASHSTSELILHIGRMPCVSTLEYLPRSS